VEQRLANLAGRPRRCILRVPRMDSRAAGHERVAASCRSTFAVGSARARGLGSRPVFRLANRRWGRWGRHRDPCIQPTQRTMDSQLAGIPREALARLGLDGGVERSNVVECRSRTCMGCVGSSVIAQLLPRSPARWRRAGGCQLCRLYMVGVARVESLCSTRFRIATRSCGVCSRSRDSRVILHWIAFLMGAARYCIGAWLFGFSTNQRAIRQPNVGLTAVGRQSPQQGLCVGLDCAVPR